MFFPIFLCITCYFPLSYVYFRGKGLLNLSFVRQAKPQSVSQSSLLMIVEVKATIYTYLKVTIYTNFLKTAQISPEYMISTHFIAQFEIYILVVKVSYEELKFIFEMAVILNKSRWAFLKQFLKIQIGKTIFTWTNYSVILLEFIHFNHWRLVCYFKRWFTN